MKKKKLSSIELVDMIKFDHEQLQQESYILLEQIQSCIDEQDYVKAINNIWFLSGAVSKAQMKKKLYENQQKSLQKNNEEYETILF